MSAHVQLDHERIEQFCQRNGIRRLALFGSALRDDFGPDSDVDILVEFRPDARVGLFKFAGMESELTEMIGRKADLRTAEELSEYFRDEVVAGAEVQYVAQG